MKKMHYLKWKIFNLNSYVIFFFVAGCETATDDEQSVRRHHKRSSYSAIWWADRKRSYTARRLQSSWKYLPTCFFQTDRTDCKVGRSSLQISVPVRLCYIQPRILVQLGSLNRWKDVICICNHLFIILCL